MSELLQNSEEKTKEQKIHDELEKVEARLREKGVEPGSLVVFRVLEDHIVGETVEALKLEEMVLKPVLVRNPRRLLRLQRIDGDNFNVNFTFIDYDLVETGVIALVAQVAMLLKALDEETRLKFCIMLDGFLDKREKLKEMIRNGPSRVVIPNLQMPPDMAGRNGGGMRGRG